MSFTTLPTFAVERARASKLTALASAISELRPIIAVKSGDTARSNNTLTDDPHLAVAMAANTEYQLDGVLRYTCASGTPDVQLSLTGPAGAVGYFAYGGASSALAAQVGTANWFGPGLATVVFVGSNDNATFPIFVRVGGRIVTSATAGNLTLQWAQVNTNANAVTMLAGSFLSLRQIV